MRKPLALLFSLILAFPVVAAGEGTPAQSTSSSETAGELFTRANTYVSVSWLSSRIARPMDYRLYKSTSSDDSGTVSENTTLPNLNYLAAIGSYRFVNESRFSFAGLQSLDPVERRTLSTPYGREFAIPARILAFKYQVPLTPNASVQASWVNIEELGFLDPMLSASYTARSTGGWLAKPTVGFTVPTSTFSKMAHLLTRASLKGIVMRQMGPAGAFAAVSHSFPVYRAGSSVSSSSSSSSSRGASASAQLEEVDLVLLERERNRTAAMIGGHTLIAPDLKYSATLGATHIRTASDRTIWLSSLRPVALSYSRPTWEISTELSLISDIREFQRLSLPRILNVGLRLGWRFGNPPPRI